MPVAEQEVYDKVATHTGIQADQLEQLVHLDDGQVRMSLPGLRLGSTAAERMRAVAQLLTVVRAFGLGEDETPLDIVRSECERLKVYDGPNFARHMRAIPGYIITGSGTNRRLRPRGPGIQAFAALVERLTEQT